MNKELSILLVDWHEAFIFGLSKTSHKFYVIEPSVLGKTRIDGESCWQTRYRPIPKNVTLISDLTHLRELFQSQKIDLALATTFLDMSLFKPLSLPKIYSPLTQYLGEFSSLGKIYPEKQKEIYDYIRGLLTHYFLAFHTREVMERETGSSKSRGYIFETYNAIPLDEYGPFTGDIPEVLRVGNYLKDRPEFNYPLFSQVIKDLPHRILGKNPGIPNASIAKDWDELRQALCKYRVFFATHALTYDYLLSTAQLEAMASGMPIVTTPHPNCMIIDGKNGYVSSDPRVLRERLISILDNQELAIKLGREARKTVAEKFNFEHYKKEWNNIFSLALKSGTKKSNAINFRASRPQLQWEGAISSGVYGEETQHIIHAMREKGILVSLHPTHIKQDNDELMAPMLGYFKALEIVGESILYAKPAPLRILFPFTREPSEISFEGETVAYLHWDYGALPRQSVELIQSDKIQKIWVNSTHERKTYEAQGISYEKLSVIPRVIDLTNCNSIDRKSNLISHDEFVFLFIGTARLEEGGNVALEAFLKEFKKDEKVSFFYLATGESTLLFQKLEQLNQTKTYPKIAFAKTNSLDTLPLFCRSATFGIVSHRGGSSPRFLPHLMSHALPVAMSGYCSGIDTQQWGIYHIIPASTYFLDESIFQESLTGKPFLTHPDVESLQEIMRHAFEHPIESKLRGILGRIRGRESLTPEKISQQILEFCRQGKTRSTTEEHPSLEHLLTQQTSTFWLAKAAIFLLRNEWGEAKNCASKSLQIDPTQILAKAVYLEADAAAGHFEQSLFEEIMPMKNASDALFLHLLKSACYAKEEKLVHKLLRQYDRPNQSLLAAFGFFMMDNRERAIQLCQQSQDEEARVMLSLLEAEFRKNSHRDHRT